MITIDQLSKSYTGPDGDVEVLKNINLSVEPGTITAVLGPSGAGKSTLSRCISLLEKPTSGTISLDGTSLSDLRGGALNRARRSIGTIFQSSALLSRLTVAENVALPLRYLGVEHQQMHQRVADLLDRVGLLGRANYFPAQLSGGQKQRVGIARALALRPRVLLSDESTSGLDPHTTQQVLNLITELRDELQLSVILITHEMDVVRAVADNVAQISAGQIVQQGAVKDFVADVDSAFGAELLPVKVAAGTSEAADFHLLVSYRNSDVNLEWVSAVTLATCAHISLLGSAIESGHGHHYGRAVVGVRGASYETVVSALQQLGLHAKHHQLPARADSGATSGAGATAKRALAGQTLSDQSLAGVSA